VKALTVRQPWASLIAAGIKPVENRTWPVPRGFTGPLMIHAAAAVDKTAMDEQHVRDALGEDMLLPDLPTSAIVAVVGKVEPHRDLIGGHCAPWGLDDCWHWVLSDVRALTVPVPAKGRLGLWTPDEAVLLAAAWEQTKTTAVA
jgi:hypothetical protein